MTLTIEFIIFLNKGYPPNLPNWGRNILYVLVQSHETSYVCSLKMNFQCALERH